MVQVLGGASSCLFFTSKRTAMAFIIEAESNALQQIQQYIMGILIY